MARKRAAQEAVQALAPRKSSRAAAAAAKYQPPPPPPQTPTAVPAAPPPPKRRKTAAKGTYEPSLLPPTLSFDLDHAISHLSAADPRFAGMFKHIHCKPFTPPLEAIDPFKTLVTSIIGQQVSWMAARAINNRFKALFGFSETDTGFPSPAQVAKSQVPVLKSAGLSTRKAEYVISLAEHFLSGALSTELLRDGTDEEISAALIAVRGIGRWTVDMFEMFSLRRPNVLAVGDLGVQKGLLRWVLAAHDALPKKKGGKGGANGSLVNIDKVDEDGQGEIDTRIATPPPQDDRTALGAPPTPVTPGPQTKVKPAVLHTPAPIESESVQVPPTPLTPASTHSSAGVPAEVLEVGEKELPPPAPEELLSPPKTGAWDAHKAAPLPEGLGIDVLKSRLSGKKVKGGAYLTPAEMEALTDHWRPYRSLAVFYMWPAGEEF